MSNKYNKFITALFCTFLGGMLVVSTLLPDKEMSELENRYLQKPPKFSVETVTDGTFMEQADPPRLCGHAGRQCVCPGVPGHHTLLLCHLGRPPDRWCAHSGRVFPH